MPTVKVIGRRTTFRGKSLFEILCNLKNFGKGRVVVRSLFEDRFPDEPSYYVITKAEPEMDKVGNIKMSKFTKNYYLISFSNQSFNMNFVKVKTDRVATDLKSHK